MNWFWDNIHLKKEDRAGMFVFLCILFCLLLVKWYMLVWHIPQGESFDEDNFASLEYTIVEPEERNKKNASKSYFNSKEKNTFHKKQQKFQTNEKEVKRNISYFRFDPNTLSIDSLRLLGFSKYASNNIIKYRTKGGRFYQAKDVQKIYGVDSLMFLNIYPFIDVKTPKSTLVPKKEIKKPVEYSEPELALRSIDINFADTTEFKKMKGIGSVYANRIVKFRNSLGGYFSIDQIKEVWGISDSLFTAIEPYLLLDSVGIQKKNINELEKVELVKHPYLDWKKVKIILSYKKMHGDYKSMDDFKKLHGLTETFVDTLTQYFSTE